MRFMMLVCSDAEPDSESEKPGEVEAWVEDNDNSGRRVMGDRLVAASEAKTVRVRRKHKIITDGPFAECKEVILGFDILECASMEEAVEVASRHPVARTGRIEIRAFYDWD